MEQVLLTSLLAGMLSTVMKNKLQSLSCNWTTQISKNQFPGFNHQEWWVGLGWLPGPHPATLSLPLLNRTGGENKTEKLVCQVKDRETTYNYPHRKNCIDLRNT